MAETDATKAPGFIPTADDVKLLQRWDTHMTSALPRAILTENNGKLSTAFDHPQPIIGLLRVCDALGLTSASQFNMFAGQALSMCSDKSLQRLEAELNEIILMVAAQQPRDINETMLCLQMVGVHVATTNALATMRNSEHADLKTEAGNLAARLSRTYGLQMDTLHRYRSKGKAQRVTVEHKHYNVAPGAVSPGAQAVFGDVSSAAPGGGVTAKTAGHPLERGDMARIAESAERPMKLVETVDAVARKVA